MKPSVKESSSGLVIWAAIVFVLGALVLQISARGFFHIFF
jgi:hypothetical protein